ncbi:hypothetical protein CSKR_103430 [Clonorchis sinensis]|uniref:Uncharacterized protein n=1 Tax=Clonorchis sinensis TaxID=79923 RepID=A0A419PIV9_CLOSI|nr:hypothetical protein CSKR_103430 [Clonorchis sinensis]
MQVHYHFYGTHVATHVPTSNLEGQETVRQTSTHGPTWYERLSISSPGGFRTTFLRPISALGSPSRRSAVRHSIHFEIRSSGGEMARWLGREFTDRKVRGSNPTTVSRLPLSRFGQPGSI